MSNSSFLLAGFCLQVSASLRSGRKHWHHIFCISGYRGPKIGLGLMHRILVQRGKKDGKDQNTNQKCQVLLPFILKSKEAQKEGKLVVWLLHILLFWSKL